MNLLRRAALALLLTAVSTITAGAVIPPDCRQLVLGIADSWDSSEVQLTGYIHTGQGWEMDLFPWPGRLGANGLAWGRGLHPVPAASLQKKEGDARTPAGAFRIGDAYGYAESIARHPDLTYHIITTRDLWVEDPASPHYNRHLKLEDREPQTPWEKKQQMRQNDPAHRLKLFIAHNAHPDIVPGSGSAIFFHVWRNDGARPTAGCTVMAYDHLTHLIEWIDPGKKPVFVVLPRAVYRQVRETWGLP